MIDVSVAIAFLAITAALQPINTNIATLIKFKYKYDDGHDLLRRNTIGLHLGSTSREPNKIDLSNFKK